MIDVLFEINGWRVNPDSLGHVLGKSVLRTIRTSMRRRLHSVRCPDHGSAPTIVVRGPRLGDLSWEVTGCCQKLIEVVQRQLMGPQEIEHPTTVP